MQTTKSPNLWLACPLAYLYLTRLGGANAVAGYIANEFLPFAVTLSVAYAVRVWLMAAAFAGFLALYEIAYVRNDAAATAQEKGGDRLAGPVPSLALFVPTRIVFALLVASGLWRVLGPTSACKFLLFSALVVSLANIHTWAGRLSNPWIRILTFAALAAYKSATWVSIFIPLREAALLIANAYLFFGLARTVAYAGRKLGFPPTAASVRFQNSVQFGTLLLFAPVAAFEARKDLLILWSSYLGVLVFATLAGRIRRAAFFQEGRAHE